MRRAIGIAFLLIIVMGTICFGEMSAKDYFDKATLQYLVGDYDSALSNLRDSLRQEPNNSAALELMRAIQREMQISASSEKQQNAKLIDGLMAAGKEAFTRGEYDRASDYFKRVLSIDFTNQDAMDWQSRTQNIIAEQKTAEENWQRQRTYLLFGIGLLIGIAALAALISFIAISIRRSAQHLKPGVKSSLPVSTPAPKPSQPEASGKPIRLQLNWTRNPFGLEVFKREFTGEDKMGYESLKNFIKSRIMEAGGHQFEPFTESAIEKVFELSRGKPRAAMIICDWSITQADNQNVNQVTAEIVRGYEAVVAKNVLIVDDEEVVRNTLDGILRRGGGYETDFAVDGQEAINKIRENSFGVVLLDLALPKMDGYEVLRQARAIRPDLPVIFLTGTAEAHKVMESLANFDLNGMIEKPFSMEKVLNAVAKAFKK